MTDGVEEDPKGLTWLMGRLPCSNAEGVAFSFVQVVHEEIQMDLFGHGGVGPRRSDEITDPLKTQIYRTHVDEVNTLHVFGCVTRPCFDLDARQGGIELGEREWIGAVQRDEVQSRQVHRVNLASTGPSPQGPLRCP